MWHALGGPRGGTISALCELPDGACLAAVNGEHAARGKVIVARQERGGRFEPCGALPQYIDVYGFAARADEIVAGTATGVYRSQDRGATWQPEKPGPTQGYVVALAIDGAGRVFAGSHGQGVWRREPGGWSALAQAPKGVRSLAAESGALYAQAEGAAWRSRGHDAWTRLTPPGDSMSAFFGGAIAVRGNDVAVVIKGEAWLSRDGGVTWRSVEGSRGLAHAAFSGDTLYLGGTYGLHRCDLGGGALARVFANEVTALLVRRDGGVLAGTRSGQIIENGHAVLCEGSIRLVHILGASVDAAGVLTAESAAGSFASRDAGDTWQAIPIDFDTVPAPSPKLGSQETTAFAIAPNGDHWRATHGERLSLYRGSPDSDIMESANVHENLVERSRDGGKTWETMHDALRVSAIACDTDGNVWFAGSGLQVWRGDRFEEVLARATGAFIFDGDGRTIVTAGAETLIADKGSKEFRAITRRYSERGAWGAVEGNASTFIAFARDREGRVWGATRGPDGGVFRLAPDGKKWESHNAGLMVVPGVGSQSVSPTSIAVLNDGRPIVGTEAHGLWRWDP